MFGYKYRMQIVNPEKGIIKLAPTLGTYAKAFAPAVVIWGLIGVAYAASSRKTDLQVQTDLDNPNED